MLAFLLTLPLAFRAVVAWHGRHAGALYDGEREPQQALARGVDRWVERELGSDDFSTGSELFDGEWLFVTRMMAVLGYAQTAIEHPELREAHATRIDRALDELIAPSARAYDRREWGHDAFDDLGSTRPHVGYLAYLSLPLAMARFVNPDTRHAELEQRVIDHLVPLYEASSLDLLETYPGEMYPVDNVTFFAALAIHDRATGQDHRALLRRLLDGLSRYRDPASGLLVQSVNPTDGSVVDGPRGSGTAFAGYLVSFADSALSRSLHESVQTHLARSFLGIGTVREYLPGEGGFGDVDSGPVIFGHGVSVTGFSIALARIHGDRDAFVSRLTTASFVGGPVDEDGTHYALGGPLGDALLFAFATALPVERWRDARRPQ
jgi:hypothetical protein